MTLCFIETSAKGISLPTKLATILEETKTQGVWLLHASTDFRVKEQAGVGTAGCRALRNWRGGVADHDYARGVVCHHPTHSTTYLPSTTDLCVFMAVGLKGQCRDSTHCSQKAR